MIEKTISEIEDRIRTAKTVPDGTRNELLALLASLRSELPGIGNTHGEEAESVARLVALSTHEATRQRPNPDLLGLSTDALSRSVKEFEVSHPKLAEAVNALASMFSDLGI